MSKKPKASKVSNNMSNQTVNRFTPIEQAIDQYLGKLLAHPLLLQTVGTVLNFNSYRKVWLDRVLTAGWKTLRLPNRRDQERTLHLINELHYRISELEKTNAPVFVAPIKSAKSQAAKQNSQPVSMSN